MRTQDYFFPTLKEIPNEADIVSHQLMLRAGMIRSIGSGLYTWLPLGLRILQKIENIVREEMNKSGAIELRMPCVQPADFWQESQRWDKFGPQLLKINDRHQREFCFGPTHEEVITDLMRRDTHSYKQLPLNLYQISTKFRDEIRPRFGVMRSREFTMKDAYSFHIDEASLQATYQTMYDTYNRIFTRLGLTFRAVLADTGAIGGQYSHEFQVMADSGEDTIVYSNSSDYAANIERAKALPPQPANTAEKPLGIVNTPGLHTTADINQFLDTSAEQVVKTIIVKGSETPFVALCLRSDHELNQVKAEKLTQVYTPLTLIAEEEVSQAFDCNSHSIGPVGLKIPVIVEDSVFVLTNFICAANENDKYWINVNWQRDTNVTEKADFRNVISGDPSPDGKGHLQLARGIEVGQIFQVGSGYSEKMQATVLNENGKSVALLMGCYGIGITRIVAAAIEQHHDEHGIIWPEALAPFQVAIVPIQYHKNQQVRQYCDNLYEALQKKNISVILDDRKERPGIMFADMDLIGIPHRITVGEKSLTEKTIEYKNRATKEAKKIDSLTAVSTLSKLINA